MIDLIRQICLLRLSVTYSILCCTLLSVYLVLNNVLRSTGHTKATLSHHRVWFSSNPVPFLNKPYNDKTILLSTLVFTAIQPE